MDNDKKLFQDIAQKLINYTCENRDYYQQGQYEVDVASERIYAFQVVLMIAIVFYFLYLALGVRISIFDKIEHDNYIFTVLFSLLFISYRRKVKEKKKVLAKRKEILDNKERVKYIDILNDLSKKHPEWNLEHWWDINGLDLAIEQRYELYYLEYFPSPLVQKNEKGNTYIVEENSMVNIMSGNEVIELIQSGDYRRLIVNKTSFQMDQQYELAALYLHRTKINEETVEFYTYLPGEVNNIMNEYREELDHKEKVRNYWGDLEKGRFETNKEKHMRTRFDGGYDFNEEVNDWFMRNQKEEKKRFDLETSLTQEKYIESYCQMFYHVGWLTFNEDRELSEILLNKEYAFYEWYDTSSYELGKKSFVKRGIIADDERSKIDMPVIDVINKLDFLELYTMDYTSKRSEEFTLEEWAAWIYAHAD